MGWRAQTPHGGATDPHIGDGGGTDPSLKVVGGHRPSSWEGAQTLILGWGAQALILGLEGADSTWGGAQTLILGVTDPHIGVGGTDSHVGGALTLILGFGGGTDTHMGGVQTLILGWGAQALILGVTDPHIGGAPTPHCRLWGGHRHPYGGGADPHTGVGGTDTHMGRITDPHIGVGGRRPSYWGSLTLILGWRAQTPHIEPGGVWGGAQTPSLRSQPLVPWGGGSAPGVAQSILVKPPMVTLRSCRPATSSCSCRAPPPTKQKAGQTGPEQSRPHSHSSRNDTAS